MSLATLSIDLNAKLAKFEGDMGKAARASEATAARMNAAFGTVKATLVGVAAGISLQGIISFANATINSLDALNDLKDATGSSIENISALEDVAKRTGTSFDTVGTSLVKFNAALKEAKPGSDAEAALKAIGLSAQELKAIDPAEALLKTATALAGFADDGNKARLTQELFGKSLKEVAPFLKDLAETGKLNATVTTAQAEKAEEFNKQLFNLQKNSQDAARTLTSDLLPALNNILKAYTTNGIKAAADQFGEAVFGWTSNQQEKRIKNLTGDIADLRKEFVSAGSYAKQAGIGTQLDAKVAELKTLKAQYFKLTDGSVGGGRGTFIKSNVDNRETATFVGGGGGSKTKEKPFELKTDSLDSYIESLRKELEVKQELSTVDRARNLIAEKGGNFSLEEAGRAISTAQLIDREKELAETLKITRDAATAAGDAIIARNEKYQATLASLLAATPSANLNKQREDIKLLTDEFEAGRLAESTYLEAVTARLDLVGEKLTQTKSLAEDLGLTFASSFEDAIVGGKEFSQIIKGLEQDILRIVTRKLVTEPLGNALTGALGGSGGAGGGVGGALGGIFSKIFSSFDGGGYTGAGARSGGLDGKGGFMALLHPRETVVDHSRGQRTGNVVNISVNQTFAANTSRATTLQAAADASRQLQFAGRNL